MLLLARVTEMIARATDVLLAGDVQQVNDIAQDNTFVVQLVEQLERDVEDRLNGPHEPGEIPHLVAVLRIAHEVELTGALAANIAKATRRLSASSLDPRIRGLVGRLGDQAVEQLRAAVEAFADADPAVAADVITMNEVMSDLMRELFRVSVKVAADQVEDPQTAIQVALMARYYERVGDHAQVIASRVIRAAERG